MKHPSLELLALTFVNNEGTVSGGQFLWGVILLKSNGGVYKVG